MTSKSDADLLEFAWGVIANAYGGDWDQAQNQDWKPAAIRWRDQYHEWLANYTKDEPVIQEYIDSYNDAIVAWMENI